MPARSSILCCAALAGACVAPHPSTPVPIWVYDIEIDDVAQRARVRAELHARGPGPLVCSTDHDGTCGPPTRIRGPVHRRDGTLWGTPDAGGRLWFDYEVPVFTNAAATPLFPLSCLLLRPAEAPAAGDAVLRIQHSAGRAVSTGLAPVVHTTKGTVYRVPARFAGALPWTAIDPPAVHALDLGDGIPLSRVRLDDRLGLTDGALDDWILDAAVGLRDYCGTFPVPAAAVFLASTRGLGVASASTRGLGGASIRLRIGRAATRAALAKDTILPHELAHLAIANLPRAHHWFEEGLATYLESVIPASRGLLPAEEVWRRWFHAMPRDRLGVRPLDGAHDRTSLYWGGALFFLVADVRLRQLYPGRGGLRRSVRHWVRDGLTIATTATLDTVLASADAAFPNCAVWRDLYREVELDRRPIDTAALWSALGVAGTHTGIRLDDRAPLAALRHALLRGGPESAAPVR